MDRIHIKAVALAIYAMCLGVSLQAYGDNETLSILKNRDPVTGALVHKGTKVEELYELIEVAKEGRLEEVCSTEDAPAVAKLAILLARMGMLDGDPDEIEEKAGALEQLLQEVDGSVHD